MNQSNTKAELLAPAGSLASLKAAVVNGADAVYLGLGTFNARASAENFSLATLTDAVNYAHTFGVRVYLAINTLLKNKEIDEALIIAKKAWDLGVSAIIVQDLGFAGRLKKEFPEIVLHASTQMGVHNLYGALVAEQLGVERVILSRETPLVEIENIAKHCSVELEHFVHGALCCSFSGNCYFSGLVSGQSGNRGRCLQLCRKRYLLEDKNKTEYAYWLSTRDTMLSDELKRLSNAGVCSFKIEGRMRRSEYASEATRIYRKALDCGTPIDGQDISDLKLMFNRGNFGKAHLNGADSDIIYPALQSNMGIKLGYVKSVVKDKAVLSCRVNKGDGIKFLRTNIESGHALVFSDGYETGFVGDVKTGDGVYLTDSAKKNAAINSRTKKLPLSITAKFSLEKKSCTFLLKCGKNTKEFTYSALLESPQKNPLSRADIAECLTSLGNTHFECEKINIESDDEFFAPKSVLKGLKRQAISDFEQYLISSFKRSCAKNKKNLFDFLEGLSPIDFPISSTIVMCGITDASAFKNYADYIAIKPDNYAKLLADIKSNAFTFDKNKYILDLPVVAFDKDLKLLQEIIDTNAFDKFIINNIYGLTFARNNKIIFGYKMNMLNNQIKFPKVLSVESPVKEINSNEDFIYMFGRPDIMQYVHCYYKLKRGCGECDDEKPITLTDDKNVRHEIKKQKIHNCYNLLAIGTPIKICEKNFKKRFFDATNLSAEEKQALLDFLKGKVEQIKTENYLPENRKLD